MTAMDQMCVFSHCSSLVFLLAFIYKGSKPKREAVGNQLTITCLAFKKINKSRERTNVAEGKVWGTAPGFLAHLG